MTLTRNELMRATEEMTTLAPINVIKETSDIIIYYLDNCEITVPEDHRFFVDVNCDRLMEKAFRKRTSHVLSQSPLKQLEKGEKALAYTGTYDFGHTSPDWESVILLGIYGLRQRLAEYAKRNGENEFYVNTLRVYDAVTRFILRSADAAEKVGKYEMADSLRKLSENSPHTLFEAMQTSFIQYTVQHMMEGSNLRTLGRLDSLFLEYYKKETDSEYANQMISDFLYEIDNWQATANIPFALGAESLGGENAYTELTLPILKAYRASKSRYTKLHLLCKKSISTDILREAFCAIREGNNSILFMSDEKITESLIKLGEDPSAAKDYHVVGCYECGGKGEITCSCNARVNLPKAVEYALTGGIDILTNEQIGLPRIAEITSFKELMEETCRQLGHLATNAMLLTENYEKHYSVSYAAPILSSTYVSALESGKEIYSQNGARYNNSSLNALGLATAVDSLAAIRKMVWEDKTHTLEQITYLLRSNWSDNEPLRLKIKNRFPKYGTGNLSVDRIAGELVESLSKVVNRRPNPRGGVWRLGTFSIDWRWEFGEKTAASANGRLKGETLSQNTGASFGCDKESATAHMISETAIDNSNTPNGSVIDVDLHSTAVEGEIGLNALIVSLKTYFELGGFAVHYNVLDTETLKKAKADPSAYPTLQVRLCGWNVLFSTLTEKEKDEFIFRFENA